VKDRFRFNRFIGNVTMLAVPVWLLLSGSGLCQDVSDTLRNHKEMKTRGLIEKYRKRAFADGGGE